MSCMTRHDHLRQHIYSTIYINKLSTFTATNLIYNDTNMKIRLIRLNFSKRIAKIYDKKNVLQLGHAHIRVAMSLITKSVASKPTSTKLHL